MVSRRMVEGLAATIPPAIAEALDMYNPVSYSGLALVLRAGVERSERDAPRISASRGPARDRERRGTEPRPRRRRGIEAIDANARSRIQHPRVPRARPIVARSRVAPREAAGAIVHARGAVPACPEDYARGAPRFSVFPEKRDPLAFLDARATTDAPPATRRRSGSVGTSRGRRGWRRAVETKARRARVLPRARRRRPDPPRCAGDGSPLGAVARPACAALALTVGTAEAQTPPRPPRPL